MDPACQCTGDTATVTALDRAQLTLVTRTIGGVCACVPIVNRRLQPAKMMIEAPFCHLFTWSDYDVMILLCWWYHISGLNLLMGLRLNKHCILLSRHRHNPRAV